MEIQNDARFLACVFEILTKPPRALHKNSSHLSYSLNPLLSPPGGLIYFKHIWGGDLRETEGLFKRGEAYFI